jgi:hypothetical protein
MSPAYARSLSIASMAFGEVLRAEYDYGKLDGVLHIALDKDDQDWLYYLVQHLGNAPQDSYFESCSRYPTAPSPVDRLLPISQPDSGV